MNTLFMINDVIKHKANAIYQETSKNKLEISYIGITNLIAEERWKQHEDLSHDSAPSKLARLFYMEGFLHFKLEYL